MTVRKIDALLALRSAGEPIELDQTLLERVFSRLYDTPEYRTFRKAYETVVQRPDYSRRHVEEMFGEYTRLLDSARTKLTIELTEKSTAF